MSTAIPAIWPIDRQALRHGIEPFGYRNHPIYHRRILHKGIDLAANIGNNVYATGDATVQSTDLGQPRRGYGKQILLNHQYGYQTRYAHLSQIFVKPGEKVVRGQLIGKVGNTGGVTGPHLHYEVIHMGQVVNPINYFNRNMTNEEYERLMEQMQENSTSIPSTNNMARTRRPIKYATPRTPKQKAIRITFHVLVWFGAAILYYVGFSLFFFDTPVEYELKHSTDQLRSEYTRLEARYDSLRTVMENVSERDRNVFNILFESDPYDFDTEYETKRLATYESLLDKSDRQIILELKEKVRQSEATLTKLNESYLELQRLLDTVGDGRNRIPAIQPVINQQLTLLTASYGMRIHPFYRTLQSHQGVDYTVPEGSRVFATADGRVKEIASRSTAGRTIVIDHGNGYETSYSHLLAVNVRRGQEVRRGDIIGLSGNTGLSIAPHLHYEVRHNGMRVDPIHYFFMELSPVEYQRIIRIAQSGMQSFD